MLQNRDGGRELLRNVRVEASELQYSIAYTVYEHQEMFPQQQDFLLMLGNVALWSALSPGLFFDAVLF